MAKAFLTRRADGSFIPAFDDDKEALRRIATAQTMQIQFSVPRNLDHHKKAMAILKFTIDHMQDPDRWTIKRLLSEVKYLTGHFELKGVKSGMPVIQLDSISFESMDQVAFEAFYDSMVNVVCLHFLKHMNITPEELKSAKKELENNY